MRNCDIINVLERIRAAADSVCVSGERNRQQLSGIYQECTRMILALENEQQEVKENA